jgi:hypothetical protein
MSTQYFCANENRRDAVRTLEYSGGNPILNGMDYLEVVTSDEKTLEVHFIHPLPGKPNAVPPSPAPALTENNFVILGGVRVQNIAIEKGSLSFPEKNVARFNVKAAGDYSTYTLMLVAGEENEGPPSGFDPQLAAIDFSFKVECPSDFDCAPEDECPPENLPAPLIDYLAKDYSSFRRLMLDRLSTVMPNWAERNPADWAWRWSRRLLTTPTTSVTTDAVGTEAYLGPARQRISVRRHARLLDYAMHDGCNARAWICFEVEESGGADGLVLNALTPILTRGKDETVMVSPDPTELAALIQEEKPVVFGTLHQITLNSAHNSIKFYTWDNTECCLPKGATRATLLNNGLSGSRHRTDF